MHGFESRRQLVSIRLKCKGAVVGKTRVRFEMNTGTRVMADRRTRRIRTRSEEERADILMELEERDCDGNCRAGRYCIQHDWSDEN